MIGVEEKEMADVILTYPDFQMEIARRYPSGPLGVGWSYYKFECPKCGMLDGPHQVSVDGLCTSCTSFHKVVVWADYRRPAECSVCGGGTNPDIICDLCVHT